MFSTIVLAPLPTYCIIQKLAKTDKKNLNELIFNYQWLYYIGLISSSYFKPKTMLTLSSIE